jgi:predicted ATPase
MIQFYVEEPGNRVTPRELPAAVLRRDTWDDYHFKTSFWLTVHLAESQALDVGTVKILHQDQDSGLTPIPTEFTQLSSAYCSLGQSLSYYEKLHQAGVLIRDAVLNALRDVVANPTIADRFSHLDGFQKSLERTGSATRAIHDAAPLLGNSLPAADFGGPLSLPFRTDVGGNAFTIPLSFNEIPELPGRTNVVIGYNGTGKTRLLANLAIVAASDSSKRKEPEVLDEAGSFIAEPDIPFGAVIAVSYSAFDTFNIPGTGTSSNAAERVQRDGELFGYAYCGLRSFEQTGTEAGDRLKTISELREDTLRALNDVRTHREELMRSAIAPLVREPSFLRADFSLGALADDEKFRTAFARLSTGHKIVLNIVLQLLAHLQLKSLVLFDEPECHLHPPLLAALLRSIAVVLEDRDSYAVIATHSPVVLQEIPGRYVHVLERFGPVTRVRRPELETFGENVGYLTKSVFNLDGRSTDYHAVLEALAVARTTEEIEELFGGQMSGQARAYVESLQHARF